jgi:hypothetical protein
MMDLLSVFLFLLFFSLCCESSFMPRNTRYSILFLMYFFNHFFLPGLEVSGSNSRFVYPLRKDLICLGSAQASEA